MTSNPLFKTFVALWQRLIPDERHRRYLVRALVMALTLRLALLGVMYITDLVLLQHAHPLSQMLDENLRRWDARHYLRLADVGYTGTGDNRFLMVFFPLYPFLIRLVNGLLQNYLHSALLISFVAAVAAGWLLQELMRRQGFDEEHIFRAFMFFCCLPMAIYTVVPLTESLFLALTLAAFVFAQGGGWFRSGLVGALASATRSAGVLLLPALAVQALLARWPRKQPTTAESTDPEPVDPKPVDMEPAHLKPSSPLRALWLLLIPTGLGVYLFLNWKIMGHPLAFTTLQAEHWNQGFVWPWEQLSITLQHLASDAPGRERFNYYEPRLLAMIAGVLLLIGGRKLPLSWQVYAWSSFLLFVCAREVISLPRYLYVLFPIYPVLAMWTRRPLVFQAALCLSTLLMASWFTLYITGNGAM
ncbi:MAG: hypothetical protein CVV27_00705 [Candidatus Melainabacteria bacterium HGW-Melainabacteria-1]|nr:MAG: hypothetical protein CVV27_00705 [Candidatus Melainabacteria bacterium HGW-Melainabacteria-1]